MLKHVRKQQPENCLTIIIAAPTVIHKKPSEKKGKLSAPSIGFGALWWMLTAITSH